MIKKLSIILVFLITGCSKNEGRLFSIIDIEKTGITFKNTVTPTEELNILDYLYFYNGGGVAVGDIDNDGLPDIFFSGNQVKNQLYLNKGNLQFEDISEKAGISGNSSWNTGAVMGDINGDGWLDIYVCAVVGINGFSGHNELFINNRDGTFTESASSYGLDLDTYSSSAAFLDFDLDGDLDIYILHHAVHTQESFGKAALRHKRSYETGDKLMRNDGNVFTDVSEEAGIYGGINGYGLGVAVADFNKDGWPDLYVGNDFHEDDYYYLNNRDGTFTESLKDHFGYTSRFSMGNDVADINHDGWPDIISLDMLPEDEKVLKSSEGDDNPQTLKLRTERFGYHYQFTRNMLQINRYGDHFAETALLSGIAATDWSWSALFEDYNLDGHTDLFISNGIPKRPNDLDYIKFVSNEQIKNKMNNTRLVDKKALALMPEGKTANYLFEGTATLRFKNVSGKSIPKDTLVSGATAYGDLDKDGDLDLIINNLNSSPAIYINKTNRKHSYLQIQCNYKQGNPFGIGTKIYSYHQGKLQYKELYTARGFQASSEPILSFGYGDCKTVDSIKIIWPDQTLTKLTNVPTGQLLIINPDKSQKLTKQPLQKSKTKDIWFAPALRQLGIDFVHKEDNYLDFNRQKLIPYKISDRGPATAVGDINNDGKMDVFFGSSKFIPSTVYIQTDSSFTKTSIPEISRDSVNEDVAAVIADFNNDTRNDLFIGTGGGDFYNRMTPLRDTYYTGTDSTFSKTAVPEYFENASVLKTSDIDNDGDLDIFVGNHAVSNNFGKIPGAYILLNNSGKFMIMNLPEFESIGMITDAIWHDFNEDGIDDLIIVGEWMSPVFLENKNGSFTKVHHEVNTLSGLWQAIMPFDIDNDGDTDYLLGNWGLNSKFNAQPKKPMKMYYSDFDENGTTETVVTTFKNGKYYPLAGLDELSDQMPTFMRKKFTLYKDFAGKTVNEIFSREQLNKARILEVHTLETGYLENKNGKFIFKPFPEFMQLAPVTTFLTYDFDANGTEEVLAAGNYFGVKPFHGRLGSFPGAIIINTEDIVPGDELGLQFMFSAARNLAIITFKNDPYLLVTMNNAPAQVYKLTKLNHAK
ncbi:VCBS repeat-containing protein [Ascidiimonas aurantiaca]|uniref:VCBS repeat-containing protein n=1 Tax=Ascidiimonas aurantiaca TaxID=1685432 RepID=UPI0030EC2697